MDTFHGNDLVTRLLDDNEDLWNRLLNNPFCMKMKEASKDDDAVLEGFKQYMIQDFLYCKKLTEYETARKSKALNQAEVEVSEKRIKKTAGYASAVFNACTNQSPGGLGIEGSVVRGACESDALKSHTDFQISTANSNDWVVSLVAMIPCIQSYYQIAMDLKDSSTHKDTVWYNLWVLENLKYGDSTDRQRKFFIDNVDRWNGQYETVNDIFRKACQGEMDFWATALRPEA
ncbi:hypothetical protein BJ322DRAFT_809347 [Thelephora terrestris]|uniref:Thiaminase-2/PQQC domain-containing protein n=1 Tax=Thelephora terrestris TaxID=56493 RepID=A0A9P6HE85_9AGAM|nr:hypothetical protein BJ322DRAFT_809347 [Thelephora terrestris]